MHAAAWVTAREGPRDGTTATATVGGGAYRDAASAGVGMGPWGHGVTRGVR